MSIKRRKKTEKSFYACIRVYNTGTESLNDESRAIIVQNTRQRALKYEIMRDYVLFTNNFFPRGRIINYIKYTYANTYIKQRMY